MIKLKAVCRYFARLGKIAGESLYDELIINSYVDTIDQLRLGIKTHYLKTFIDLY